MAVQLWVLRGAGLDVRDAGVLTLNREYVYDGMRLDLHSLFELHPVFDEAYALLDTVGGQVREMQAMLAQPASPDIVPGDHCFVPYECPYHAHCTRDHSTPDHGISELPRLTAQRRIQLKTAGIEEIRDVPADFPLTALQRIVRRTVREGRALVHNDLPSALAGIVPPVRHLDFETFSPAIPRFAGTRPYDAIPFLFSVHIEHANSPPGHVDYLHDHDDDPRPRLAERLMQRSGTKDHLHVRLRAAGVARSRRGAATGRCATTSRRGCSICSRWCAIASACQKMDICLNPKNKWRFKIAKNFDGGSLCRNFLPNPPSGNLRTTDIN